MGWLNHQPDLVTRNKSSLWVPSAWGERRFDPFGRFTNQGEAVKLALLVKSPRVSEGSALMMGEKMQVLSQFDPVWSAMQEIQNILFFHGEKCFLRTESHAFQGF